MTTQATPSSSDSETLGTSRPSLGVWLGLLKAHVAAWVDTCVAYYDAAILYDQLSGLSNAELHRRGLSRDTLARDVCDTCAPRQTN